MSYQDRLKTHLAEYKRMTLGISEPGVFRYRGREVFCDHILPQSKAFTNLFEEAAPAAEAFFADHPRKRHRYFHHLNSSQAFAFNLFFPYFSGPPQAAAALLRALGQTGTLDIWTPEFVPVSMEDTNIDVYWVSMDRMRTFCEVKLSEVDFGKAANDDRHRRKLRKLYQPILTGHLASARLEPSAFFEAYQFNRNVWHMIRTKHSRLLFLLPRANATLWAQLQSLLPGVVSSARGRISAVAVEDVVEALSTDRKCPQVLRDYACRLGQKYVIENAT